jgi:HD-GYP domain-containing protein (c-di-GMP phosphodiesterase class II)
MTTHRPYQDAVPREEALAELRRCAGTHFDPAVVAVLCGELRAREAALDRGDPAPLDPTFATGPLERLGLDVE